MFQISPLPRASFTDLAALDDAALAERRAMRCRADAPNAFPCRVSLADAVPGEELLLLHYEHQAAPSPFRASHAIYVRIDAQEARLAIDEVPAVLRTRTLSLRAFDANGMIVDAELIDGRDAEAGIVRLLADPATDYIHAHFAKYGCFGARIDRA